MATTQGFVGTIEVETRGTARIWFGLTESKSDDNWIKIAGKRAWFTLNLERTDQLNQADDPIDFVTKGQRWHQRWTTGLA